jgi:hypothetical protein
LPGRRQSQPRREDRIPTDNPPQAANDNVASPESANDNLQSRGNGVPAGQPEVGEGNPTESTDQTKPAAQTGAGTAAANDNTPQAANDDVANPRSANDSSLSRGDGASGGPPEAGEDGPAEPATEQEANSEQEPAQVEQPQSPDEVPPDENPAPDHAQDDDAAAHDDYATAMQQARAQLGDGTPAPETTSAPTLTGSGAVPAGGEGTDFMDADNYTATGHEVTYTKTATALGSDERTMSNLRNVASMEGVHDVIAHGTKDGFISLRNDTAPSGNPEYDGEKVNAGQIVDAVRSNPNYAEGTPLRMMVCHSGVSGAAQQVADEMGVPVLAPNGLVGTNRVLGPGQEPLVQNNAGWTWVLPKGDK